MQIGKNTTILKNINSFIPNNLVGGFMCQRLVADEETKAFYLTSIDKVESSIIEYKPDIPNVFLENVSGKWVRNDEVFNTIGIEILSNSGNIPIIGVIKSNNHKSFMKKSVMCIIIM